MRSEGVNSDARNCIFGEDWVRDDNGIVNRRGLLTGALSDEDIVEMLVGALMERKRDGNESLEWIHSEIQHHRSALDDLYAAATATQGSRYNE